MNEAMIRDDILNALGDLVIDVDKAKEVIDEYLNTVVVELWHVDDILSCSVDYEIVINSKEAEDILHIVRYAHDGEEGLTWAFIGRQIECYAEGRKDEEYALRVGDREEV